MHQTQHKLNKIKSNRRASYARKLFEAWDKEGRPLHRIPRLRILDDAIVPILIQFGLDPEFYYKTLKRKGFPVQYKLYNKAQEDEKRKDIRERKRLENRIISEMDLELKIIDGLICPVCFKPLEGLTIHPACNATYTKGDFQKLKNSLSAPKQSRRSFKIKR